MTWQVLVNVLTLLSLLAAIYQLVQARNASKSLTDISGSMSTKYVGKFPDHLSEITRLLRTAKRKVVIVCDLLGYGYYSNPTHYMQYKACIADLSGGDIEVVITIYDEARAMAATKEQLGDSFDEISKSETFKNYLNFYNKRKEPPTTMAQFYDSMKDDYRKQYNEFNVGTIKIRKAKASKSLPVFFWVVDDRAAVFSFPSLSIDPPEVAFETSDRNLLQMFARIREDVERGGEETDTSSPGRLGESAS